MSDCPFCAIVAGEAPASVVHEDDRTVAFLDVQPANTGHTLVVPRHEGDDVVFRAKQRRAARSALDEMAERLRPRL